MARSDRPQTITKDRAPARPNGDIPQRGEGRSGMTELIRGLAATSPGSIDVARAMLERGGIHRTVQRWEPTAMLGPTFALRTEMSISSRSPDPHERVAIVFPVGPGGTDILIDLDLEGGYQYALGAVADDLVENAAEFRARTSSATILNIGVFFRLRSNAGVPITQGKVRRAPSETGFHDLWCIFRIPRLGVCGNLCQVRP